MKKKVVRKTVKKAAPARKKKPATAAKAPARKNPAAKAVSSPIIVRRENTEPPRRLPVKKVVGVELVRSNSKDSAPQSTALVSQASDSQEVKADGKATLEIVRPAKAAWDRLPKYVPPHTRFLMSMAKKECEAATKWPFPFAKFIATLPSDICGLEFAMLVLNLEHAVGYIAAKTKLSDSRVADLIVAGNQALSNKFATECLEMNRKVRTQLAGSGVDVDSLIERFLISQVDRSFQVLLCALILKALGVKSEIYDIETQAVANV